MYVAFLLDKYPHAIQADTLEKIANRVQDMMGINYLAAMMQQDSVLRQYDTESIALNLDENINKYFHLNKKDNTYTVELHAAQPDRVYTGKRLGLHGDKALQEISPGVAIAHDASVLIDVTKADIGKHLSIAYDSNGVPAVSRGKQLDRGNEIDR